MQKLTPNALQILQSRYLQRDASGALIESPDEMFRRVARAIASAELQFDADSDLRYWESVFYDLMVSFDFLPNSPTLMNAGRRKGQLSACFVLPLKDDLGRIFSTLKEAALIHQSGGGTGFNFSPLRPKGSPIHTYGGTSSGPVSFIKIFDATTASIKQGGRRRGANMGVMDIDHPDIEEFIKAKSDRKSLKNFNLSVSIPDKFMHALQKGGSWSLFHRKMGKPPKRIEAKQLWGLIVQQAWQTGDPGMIFSDTINRYNPLPEKGRLKCTNPCGEMPLLAYESCNLGSVNMANMLTDNGQQKILDWEKLGKTVKHAIRFLDNVIEVNHYTSRIIKEKTRATRKIGLGVMGWAELLIDLGIPYASEAAVLLGEQLMEFIRNTSRQASRELAEKRGCFPAWKDSHFAPNFPLRNATCNSIAPTGTISIIAGTSSSIEPLFALAFHRMGILDNRTQLEVNRQFLEVARHSRFWERTLSQEIYEKGSIQDMQNIPKQIKELFKTSLEISWEYHIRHQVAFQKHVDNAVSKTINFPNNATPEQIGAAFFTAWKLGAKGITVYRYGSKRRQVLRLGDGT